jgi:peptide/nickel transport system substrate-binding protein
MSLHHSARGRLGLAIGAFGASALLLAGCAGGGGNESTDGGNASDEPLIVGTTDKVTFLDPAGSYDNGSLTVQTQVFPYLVNTDFNSTEVVPDLAESAEFTSPTEYTVTLPEGLKWANGNDLTSSDVKFSFDRNIKIEDPNGGSSLFANLKNIETPDEKTVIFNLKAPDATWPFVLTTGSAAIVPDSYPADKLQPSDEVIGSGRYTLDSYKPGTQTVLKKNDSYTGSDPAENDSVIIQLYKTSSDLALALKQDEVDLAYRSLSPTDIDSLKGESGIQVVSGNGIEIRYLVFNLDLQPGSSDAQKLAVRQAVAYTIDRNAIASKVYEGTVEPLYSMVPQGLQYATEAFKDEYGASPDVNAAKAELQKAGVKTPLDLEIWYTPTHYGTGSADEYAEIQHELEDSGLFNVTLKSTEWNQYDEAAVTDKYPQFQFGWFPDYPDADDYTTPFFAKTSFLNDHYVNPAIDKLLADEQATTNQAQRQKDFAQIQKIAAQDVPTIPIWQGGQVAAVRDGVHGVEDTFDPAYLFRLWVISKD